MASLTDVSSSNELDALYTSTNAAKSLQMWVDILIWKLFVSDKVTLVLLTLAAVVHAVVVAAAAAAAAACDARMMCTRGTCECISCP
jgi:hypothetical protein